MVFLGNVVRRDLIVSIGALGFIIVLAVSQLALQGNWPKVLRVSLAFLTYSAVLLSFARYVFKLAGESIGLPFWIFAVAGGAADCLRLVAARLDLERYVDAAPRCSGAYRWFALACFDRVASFAGENVVRRNIDDCHCFGLARTA